MQRPLPRGRSGCEEPPITLLSVKAARGVKPPIRKPSQSPNSCPWGWSCRHDRSKRVRLPGTTEAPQEAHAGDNDRRSCDSKQLSRSSGRCNSPPNLATLLVEEECSLGQYLSAARAIGDVAPNFLCRRI